MFYCSITVQPDGIPEDPVGQVAPVDLLKVPLVGTPVSQSSRHSCAEILVARHLMDDRFEQPENI